MISRTALELCLNLMSCYLIVEAYLRPPRGWIGRPWMRVVALSVFGFSFGAVVANATLWVMNEFRN